MGACVGFTSNKVSPRSNASKIAGSAASNQTSSSGRRVLGSLIQTTVGNDHCSRAKRVAPYRLVRHRRHVPPHIPPRRASGRARAAIAHPREIASRDAENRMITLTNGEFQNGYNVRRLKRRRESARISACAAPLVKSSKTSFTRMRSDWMQGRPPHCRGSKVMWCSSLTVPPFLLLSRLTPSIIGFSSFSHDHVAVQLDRLDHAVRQA